VYASINPFEMKNNIRSKTLFAFVIILSFLSAVYLELQEVDLYQVSGEPNFAEAYICDNSFLPDVKIVKEILKSIFNVVRS
jgi:hypothetical protein